MPLRARLRPVKRALARPAELAVGPIVGWIAASLGPRAREWTSGGGQRVLVVAPHPDDEVIGCAGTMLRHTERGDRVCVAIATDGRRSRAAPDPDTMARIRRAECERAARELRAARLEWLGLPEGDWQTSRLASALAALLADFSPSVIYAPSCVDFHPEHRAVAHALALGLEKAGTPPSTPVRVYQVQVPLTPLLINLAAEVSTQQAQRAAAVAAYASQRATLESAERLRRYSSRIHGGRCLEVFWQTDAARYARIHRGAPEHWSHAFRGMRPFPLSDPLAWLLGNSERRRLAALSSEAGDAVGLG
jgi:LmbE family N-acetylglucosaminyl deacetylase